MPHSPDAAPIVAALAGLAMLATASLAPAPASAGPEADLWPRWSAHDASSTTSVDHTVWDRLTRDHVRPGPDGVARLDYGAFGPVERGALAAYVERLSATPVSRLNRDEQYAYWLNFYNALTVKVVLEHYPVESIRDIDISPGLFANGPWGAKLVTVEGERLSLDDIEHRILRPIWRDPRIHYGVNCASIGCPDLRAGAYLAADLDAALDAAARAYVNHPRGALVEDGALTVSSIYRWFEEDFGGTDAGVIAHLRRYASPALARDLAGITRIANDAYDWDLNDVESRAPAG